MNPDEFSSAISGAKQLLFDLATKIDTGKTNLNVIEINRLLGYSVEVCGKISLKASNPKEKEYYFNLCKMINVLMRDYNPINLDKYLRIVLLNPCGITNENVEKQKESEKQGGIQSKIVYNGLQVDLWDENDRLLIKNLYISKDFVDPNGFLQLSQSLQYSFAFWKRPKDIFKGKISLRNSVIKPNQIKQTQVGDCSLISSIIILLNYEQKFNILAISKNIIFPDCYNEAGKYAVRLFLDGKWVRVFIDDFLPVSKYGSLLCSHTINEGELYVSLLEKAYLKYHNGYDFPGSTSSTDIWRLIKWIPEFIYISDSDKAKLWLKMTTISRDGSGVMAAGTGSFTGKLGLAEEHCYAILDTMEIECGRPKPLQLMIMQNPWRESKIQDQFSFKDYNSLPMKMKEILADIKSGEDKGMFFIEFDRFYKNPQFLIYNVKYDPLHPSPVMWLLIHHHLEKPLLSSKKVVNLRIFLTTQESVERIDKSYCPDKIFPLDLTKYYKKQFALAKIYLKELYLKYHIENMKFIVIVTYSDAAENADFNSLISYSLYFYSNFQFELGEIQSTSQEHEFHETISYENNEGFTNFDNSCQFIIDIGETGQYKDQSLEIQMESANSSDIQAFLVINTLKREFINQRISEEMMNELGLQLCPKEKKVNSSLIVQEYNFQDIARANLVVYSDKGTVFGYLLFNRNVLNVEIDFSLKIKSKNEVKCFKIKKISELLLSATKVKDKLTPNNLVRQIGPIFIMTVEKHQSLLIKSTNKIKLALYKFPYRQFKSDFSDVPFNNISFTSPIVETYSHTNNVAFLERGTYFLRIENFINNPVYQSLGGVFLFYLYGATDIKMERYM